MLVSRVKVPQLRERGTNETRLRSSGEAEGPDSRWASCSAACERIDTVERDVQAKTSILKSALHSLGKRLDDGDESELLVWVIPGMLACAHRPLRHHKVFGRERKGRDLPPEAAPLVLQWAQRVKTLGIRSIVSLMHSKELRHYASLDLGAKNLFELYEKVGFQFRHIEWDDPAHRPNLKRSTYKQELERVQIAALEAFDQLPKPILFHCSAGIDRSSPVAAHIFQMRGNAAHGN